MLRLVIALCLLALPVQAEEVVAGLSRDTVQITTNFDGSASDATLVNLRYAF